MIPLDKHDLTMLHVLSSEKLMLKSLKAAKAGQELFPPRRVPHLDLLWRHFIRFAIQSKKEGHWLQWDRQAYVADCLEELKQRDDISDECKARFQSICVQYIGAEPLDAAAGDKLLMDAVNEAIRTQISRAVYNSEAFDGIRQLVNKGVELKESLETADEKQKLFVNPLLEVETYLHVLPKMPTGVRYFDRVTNGGMSEGEVALIAGLMGGGKTATAIQLVGSQLLVGNPVAWFTFEQPFDQDLMQRMVSFITGYSLDIIRGREFKDLPEDIRTKFLGLSNQMSDKLIAADFSNNNMLDKNDPEDDGSVYSLRKRLDIWADQGKVPTYIMFDWVGAAVKRLAAVRSIDIGQITNYIALANEIIDGLVQLAKQYHTRVIFFHQLDPAIKKSPPSRKPTTVELQMMKTMSNYTQYAMAIGKRDENQRCWFICDKCRNSYPSECVIELDGAHAKFNLLEGYAPGRNGQFININELQEELSENSDTEDSYQPII